ncbi:MAG TPA: hypothetical protein VJP05_00910 [Acidimicrobiia bacterium]|nr:hypothetical protein [Acidimicrobiia bacterium]
MDAAESITCVECRGKAHLVSFAPPEEGFSPGDVITYVCEDCRHRVDLVFESDDSSEHDG